MVESVTCEASLLKEVVSRIRSEIDDLIGVLGVVRSCGSDETTLKGEINMGG